MPRSSHEVFRTPFPIDEQPTPFATPEHYFTFDPKVEKELPTLRITRDKPREWGLVTTDLGFSDSPDVDWIAGGIHSKGPGYAAIARHGAFVLWGFHGSPDEMTETGQKLFLNVLSYAHKHAGARVEVRRETAPRDVLANSLRTWLPRTPAADRAKRLDQMLGTTSLEGVDFDAPETVEKWLGANLGFVRADTRSRFGIDAECKQLGVANHVPAFLDALRARFARDPADPLATTLLRRYVPGVEAAGFGAWLERHRAALYFTDWGGYTWRVRSPSPAALQVTGADADDPVTVAAELVGETLVLTIAVQAGWHCYAPGETVNIPISVEVLAGSAFSAKGALAVETDAHGHVTGTRKAKLELTRTGSGEKLRLAFTYQVCDESTCLPPKTLQIER